MVTYRCWGGGGGGDRGGGQITFGCFKLIIKISQYPSSALNIQTHHSMILVG